MKELANKLRKNRVSMQINYHSVTFSHFDIEKTYFLDEFVARYGSDTEIEAELDRLLDEFLSSL